jgi:hypothetical protein
MKTFPRSGAIALGVMLAVGAPFAAAHHADETPTNAAATATVTAPKLHDAMRALWHGHIVTTRDYALAVHAGDDTAATKAADAVVANAKDIANAVAGFYGEAGGQGILELLAGHWQGVQALTQAAKAGDAAKEEAIVKTLADNAGAIAKFLATANPNLPEDAVRGALVMHTVDHKAQLDMMMANAPQAQQDESWARMQEHMDMIADTLSDGIAKQFPDKAK